MLRASATTVARLKGGRTSSGASKARDGAGVPVGSGVAVGVGAAEVGVLLGDAPTDAVGAGLIEATRLSWAAGAMQPAVARHAERTQRARRVVPDELVVDWLDMDG